MSTLLELAGRVEAAVGPDRELDAEIVCVANIRPDWMFKSRGQLWLDRSRGYTVVRFADEGMKKSVGNPTIDKVPAYTGSIDAAKTLMLEGWAIERLSYWPASPEGADNTSAGQSGVTLVGTSLKRFGRTMVWGHSGKDGRVEGSALTPALALTAASLRALASMGSSG